LLIEVEGFTLLSLAGLGSFEKLLQMGRIAFRSPTIDVHSKLGQLSQRDELVKRLKKLGVRVAEVKTPGKAVEW
jgi:hypothetical protein